MKKVLSVLLVMCMLLAVTSCSSGSSDSSETSSSESSASTSSESESSSTSSEESSTEESSSSSESSTSDSTEASSSAETPTVSIMMSGANTPNAQNMVLDALGENTNTIIDMNYVTDDDYGTKLSTMAASDTLPDIFSVSGTTATEFVEAGLIYDLTGLEDQAPNWFGNAADLLDQMSLNKDGLYVIPDGFVGYAYNLNIRTDWLANVGLDMPTNLDELYEVLDAFTNGDPNQNGEDDTFGLCAGSSPTSFDTIFGAYGIACNNNSIVLDDGTVSTYQKHPNYLEAIKYIRSIINAGYVEPDWLTITAMDEFGKLWNGIAGMIDMQCVGPTNNWYPSRYTEEVTPTFGFAIIEGPDGQHGVSPRFATLNGGYCFAANTADVEADLRVADYCCTDEGNTLLYLGVEGVMFEWTDKENGEYELLGEYADTAVHRANGGFCYARLCRPKEWTELKVMNTLTREGVDLAHENMITDGVVNCYDTLSTRSDYGSDMDDCMNEMYVALLQADSDDELQSIYDEYMTRWETECHGTEWEQEITEWYNEHQ